jgi:hypothetical protein
VADKFILTSKTQPIDITNLKPGLYFARLTNDNGSRFIGKIIKK